MTKLPEGPVFVETAIFYNGRFTAWQPINTFPSRAAAWKWLQSRGYKCSDRGDKFLVSPGKVEDIYRD